MKRNIIFTLLISIITLSAKADTLSEILKGSFKAQTLSISCQDSILNPESVGRYALRHENDETMFRHSFVADYFIVDTQKNKETHLSSGKVRDAVISPNGKYIAFCKANKLWIHKLDFGTEVPVTVVDEDNLPQGYAEIYEGATDWLYEEEFGTTSIMAFSPDSKQLAFIRLQEKDVPAFAWQEYSALYPTLQTLRYPKAGCHNAQAEVCVYDINTKAVKVMQIGDNEDCYLPRLCWTPVVAASGSKTPAESKLMVLKMNRDQNEMEVWECNPKSTISKVWYREKSKDCYVDYSLFDEWQWLTDGRVLLVSEKSGWKQAYLYSAQGTEQRQLTQDGKDVTAVYGLDEKTQTLYYQQADQPEIRNLYAMNIKKGTFTQLNSEQGWNTARFAADYSKAIFSHENTQSPNQYTLFAIKADKISKLSADAAIRSVNEANANMLKQWQGLNLPEKEWFTFNTERDDELHGWMLSSANTALEKNGKKPVVMTQYSGPASQRVVNRWKRTWDYALAEMGYIVVCVDGRGTDARGRKWRNETYMNLGQKEAEDQISAAQYVATWAQADANRMAMVGWSYGGFQVLTTMSVSGHPFKAGIAIAPVTDWKLYDSAYTERYMRRPQVNDYGYEKANLISKAQKLEGELLIVHGLADDNVHAQNTLLYTDALVQAGKQFEEQIYVDDNHFLRKRANYEHLHRRLLKFLEKLNY